MPPSPGGTVFTTLFATIMPTPPAACTFTAFTEKLQLPRSTSTIFPTTLFCIAVQASDVGAALSAASTRLAVTLKTDGPKEAVPVA